MTRTSRKEKWKNKVLMAGFFGMVASSLVLGGCMSYANVPVPESAPAFKSANHFQSVSVMTQSLERVIDQHPSTGPGGQYAINLPVGTTPESAYKIIEALPQGAIVPFAGMSEEIPVYHICRVWIRAREAKVDVIYPAIMFDGSTQDQNVTIWMRGGIRSWRFNRQQFWSPGTIAKPAIYIPIELTDLSGATIDDSAYLNDDVNDQLDDGNVDESPAADEMIEATESPVESSVEQVQDPAGAMYRQVPTDG